MNRKVIHLGLDVLDRQLVDKDGHNCGKVDDLEFSFPEDPSWGKAPFVTHVLTGPGALGGRLWGWPGRIARALWRRMHPDVDPVPVRLSWGSIAKLDFEVHLALGSKEAELEVVEDWLADLIIKKIPGS